MTELRAVEVNREAAIQVASTHISDATVACQQRQQAQDKHATTVENMAAQMASISIALARSDTAVASSKVADQAKAELPSVHISELLAAYLKHPSTEGKDGRNQYQSEVKAFVRSMGDMLIRDISAPVMRRFLEIERELPTGLTKRINASPGKSIEEVVSIAFRHGAKKVELSTATQ